jgi:hypothetical protein
MKTVSSMAASPGVSLEPALFISAEYYQKKYHQHSFVLINGSRIGEVSPELKLTK